MKRFRRAVDCRTRRLQGLAAGGILCLLLSARLAYAQLPICELTTIFPPGGKQGTTVDVNVGGANQDDLVSLSFSHPGITAKQKMNEPGEFLTEPKPRNGEFEVTIGADVPPGTYEARVTGRFGVSNPRAFVVGTFDEVVETGSNNQAESSQPLSVGSTVNGRAEANSVDFYKLTLTAGQRVLVDCRAMRIDARMDATLVIYDAQGKELARNLDYEASDPLLDFTAPQDGDYTIALYDFVYAGGSEYFYRLTVHSGPHIEFIFPPAGIPGSNNGYTIYGRNLPGGQPSDVVAVDGSPLERIVQNIPLPGDEVGKQDLSIGSLILPSGALLDSVEYRIGTAYPSRVYFARAAVVTERETNDRPEQAQPIPIPCEFTGQFYPERDDDWVEFEAQKGQVFWIEVISQRMGLDSDPYIAIQKVTTNDKGEEVVADVAQVDDPGDRNGRIGSDFDTSTDDPAYRLVAPEDARYRVLLRDQFGASRRDPRLVYRLLITAEQPDFRLVAVPKQIKVANNNQVALFSPLLRKGGTTLVEVSVERRHGFQGEVDVEVEGLPAGVSCPGARLGGDVTSAVLVFRAAEDAAPWSGSLHIVGKANVADREIVRVARAGAVVWGTGNRTAVPPQFRVTRDLQLAVSAAETAPALVEVGDGTVLETSRGGKLQIPVKVTRRGEFKENVALVPTGLPNEIKPGNVTINNDAAEGTLEVPLTNNNAKPGTYTFYLRSDTKVKYSPNPDAVTRAQQEQKQLEEIVKALGEQVKQADAAKNQATQAAAAAAEAAKSAEQTRAAAETAAKQTAEAEKQAGEKLAAAKAAADKDSSNQGLADAVKAEQAALDEAATKNKAAAQALTDATKALADAQAKAQSDEQAKLKAEQELKALQDKAKRAADSKAAADKSVADVTKANAAKDVNIALVSTPIQFRVVPSPVKLNAAAPAAAVNQGGKLELPVNVERLYGFDDQIELTLEIPGGVAGLAANKVTLPKDQATGKLELNVANNATPGQHTLTIRARMKFNNVNVESSQPVAVTVDKVAQPAN